MAEFEFDEQPAVDRVTLAILAGGAGSRMGTPKGHLRLGGRPILEHLLDRLDWPGPTLLITAPCRERPPGWERFDAEATDPVADEGPLRGVHTALSSATTEIVLVGVVDMPLVERRQLEWLVAQLATRREWAAAMLERDAIEPFPSVYRREAALPLVTQMLANGRRAVHGLTRVPAVGRLEVPSDWPVDCWINLNEPGDLERLENALRNDA